MFLVGLEIVCPGKVVAIQKEWFRSEEIYLKLGRPERHGESLELFLLAAC